MNHINDLVVDTPIKINSLSSDNTLKINGMASDDPPHIREVSQGGTSIVENYDYNPLFNHPHIEGNELIGNKTYDELGLNSLSFSEIEDIINS